MAIRPFLAFTAAGLAAVALALAGCGGSDSAAPTTTKEPTATNTTAPTGKISVNNSTRDELIAAFEAAGIPSADRWADEVTEYRPYSVDDTSYAQLRTELAKYNPPPEVLEKIIAMMKLP
jgi:hypothetical protein